MTENAAAGWPREVLDDLAERLAGDPWWGQVAWSDDRLAELLDDPRAADPWPILRPLPPGADMARVIEASRAPCRLGEHARAARRAALTEEERAAVDAEARERLMERRRALGMTKSVDEALPLEVLALATNIAEHAHAVAERTRRRTGGMR